MEFLTLKNQKCIFFSIVKFLHLFGLLSCIVMESRTRNPETRGRQPRILKPWPEPDPETTPTLDFNYKTPKSKGDVPEMLIPDPTPKSRPQTQPDPDFCSPTPSLTSCQEETDKNWPKSRQQVYGGVNFQFNERHSHFRIPPNIQCRIPE